MSAPSGLGETENWFCVCPVGPGATWDLLAVERFMSAPSGPGETGN